MPFEVTQQNLAALEPLFKPWQEPTSHREPILQPGRRQAGYWFRSRRPRPGQPTLYTDEQWEELKQVNDIRARIREWREGASYALSST
jgi:type III restriction enzyme